MGFFWPFRDSDCRLSSMLEEHQVHPMVLDMSVLEAGLLSWQCLPSSPSALTSCLPSRDSHHVALNIRCNVSFCDPKWWSTHFPYFGKPDLKMLTLKRVNLWHYFLQYLIHFIVIFSIAKTRLQRIWAGAYSVESTVLICIFKPRLCMCTLCSHQMPAGEHFLHCCIPTAVAQISKFEPTACLKQSPQKKE